MFTNIDLEKLLYFLLLPYTAFSQDIPLSVSLIDVNYTSEGVFFDRLDPTYTNTHTKLFDQLFTTTSLDSLQIHLSELKGIKWNVIDTLKEYISYNSLGLPNPLSTKSAIKKVTKKGFQSSQFLQLSLRLGVESDVIGQARLLKRIKPKLEVILTFIDRKGTIIQKRIVRSVFHEFILSETFGTKGFSKKNRQHIVQLEILLQPFIGKSISDAVKKIK